MRILNTYDSPLGRMVMCCEDGGITDLCFEKDFHVIGLKRGESPVFDQCKRELDRYFAGDLTEFTVPLNLKGTPFQMSVWDQLMKIPYGELVTYLDIAKGIGKPKAFRVVGVAIKSNRVLIIVPCHRVVGVNGQMTGYSAGIEIKKQLLDLEYKYR